MSAKDRAAREAPHRAAMKARAAKPPPPPEREPQPAQRPEPILKRALNARQSRPSEPKQGNGLFGSPTKGK